jgi:mannonate dehydratase
MALENTWRWFGPQDPITLRHIKQTGATGIVSALHHVPIGEVWTVDEITKRKQLIEAEGLRWSVAESLPVHEDIKRRTGNYRRYIDNYRQSLVNLGRGGIDIVCYNFMPLLDWSRTDLRVESSDGSVTTKFEYKAFAAFDLFVLGRPDAERDYEPEVVKRAQIYFRNLDQRGKDALAATVLLGLPGSEDDAFTLEGLRQGISAYKAIGDNGFRSNFQSFLKEIIPVAEETGISMALHPDDPPRPLLGMPRAVGNEADIDQLLKTYDSPSNGLTFCTGSLGAGTQNNVVSLVQKFSHRISFIHMRNVTKNADGDFVEADHLDGDVDMYGVMRALVLEQKRREDGGRKDRRMPMRPDHGRLTLADEKFGRVYPGYSLFGRMRALAELRGLELGVRRSLGLQ